MLFYKGLFFIINLCPEHNSYWNINPAEAEAVKKDLKKDLRKENYFLLQSVQAVCGALKALCLLYTGGSLSEGEVARTCTHPNQCLHNMYSEIPLLC
jgi:hypothetical protein